MENEKPIFEFRRHKGMTHSEAMDLDRTMRLTRLLSATEELLKAVEELEGTRMEFPTAKRLAAAARIAQDAIWAARLV